MKINKPNKKVQQLRNAFDKNRASINLDDNEIHVNDIASLLKLYIRELPSPILTFKLYDPLIQAAKMEGDER